MKVRWLMVSVVHRDPIEPAEPVDLIRYVMEQRGLQGSGGCARLARLGVLNRRRPLTIKMAWRLHRAFGIPAGALIKPYELIR
jgi:HTH-type transcriptional regulator/antitoxin HigA